MGSAGPLGPQGPVGAIHCWASYREFWFDTGGICAPGSDIRASDSGKITEIAEYLKKNPTLLVGLDGPDGRHVDSVHKALVKAGVEDSRIKHGAFGDAGLRRDNRVEVLLISSN